MYETARALLLSVSKCVGPGCSADRPLVSLRRYTTSLAASDKAMISASQVDKAMLFCLREPHDNAADCQSTTHPDVDEAVSQEASE